MTRPQNQASAALVAELIAQGVLKNPHVHQAFTSIDRARFIPDTLQKYAYDNAPLPIGQGQTISQPYTVAFMLDLLDPRPGQNILDIGSGSGWQTALLTNIVGTTGHVTALEIVPELVDQARDNLARAGIADSNIELINQSAAAGFKPNAPYDRIIAAAELAEIPQAWINQLKPQGTIVAPVRHSLVVLTKNADESISTKEFPGFAFVPFT